MADAPKQKESFVSRLLGRSGASDELRPSKESDISKECECFRQFTELAEHYFEDEDPERYEEAKNNHFLFRRLHRITDEGHPYFDIDLKKNMVMCEIENAAFTSSILQFLAENALSSDTVLRMKQDEFGEYAQISIKELDKEKISDLYQEIFPHKAHVLASNTPSKLQR